MLYPTPLTPHQHKPTLHITISHMVGPNTWRGSVIAVAHWLDYYWKELEGVEIERRRSSTAVLGLLGCRSKPSIHRYSKKKLLQPPTNPARHESPMGNNSSCQPGYHSLSQHHHIWPSLICFHHIYLFFTHQSVGTHTYMGGLLQNVMTQKWLFDAMELCTTWKVSISTITLYSQESPPVVATLALPLIIYYHNLQHCPNPILLWS